MASSIAATNKNISVPGFDKKKDDIMLNGLRAKFTQYPNLGGTLLSTNNKELIEHYMYDTYWADGGDGSGANIFGKLLMKVRQELKNGTLTYDKPFVG